MHSTMKLRCTFIYATITLVTSRGTCKNHVVVWSQAMYVL